MRVLQRNLIFPWFTADEEFGQNPRLCVYLEQIEIPYTLGIPKNTEVTDRAGQQATIEHRAARLAPNDWTRRAHGIGTKEFRVYDWALLDSDNPDHPYLIRRRFRRR